MGTTAEKIGRVGSIIFVVINAVTFGFCVIGFLRVRGHFAGIFKDMLADVELPALTACILNVPGAVVLALAVVLLALLVAKEWLRPIWIPLTLNALWLALGSVLVVLFLLAMLMPLASVVTKLQ